MIHTQPSTAATAGQPFAVQPVIYIRRFRGNLETGDNTTVVTASLGSGSGPLEGTVTATRRAASPRSRIWPITRPRPSRSSSPQTASPPGPQPTSRLAPVRRFRLLIHTQPSTSATAGQAFATQPVVYEVDQYGNLESADNSTADHGLPGHRQRSASWARLRSRSSAGSPPSTTWPINPAGTISLIFSGGGFTVGPSNSVFISPGPAAS